MVLVALAIGVGLYVMPISPIAESAALAQVNAWETTNNADSLLGFYESLRQPVGAAFYAHKRAKSTNEVDDWTEAGERFLLIAKYMGDQPRKKSWFAESRACFEKATELAPEDLDIKVDLGVCLIEGASLLGTPPMEGIGILKSVEQQDPKNIKALINLGYFSIQSGQFEKAEERFAQVLQIDEKYAEAYLYLADLHERQKMYEKAIADLENYKSLIEDPVRTKEVDNYILELSKNI